MLDKRGQITIFISIGIIILISIGLLLFLNLQLTKEEAEIEEVIEIPLSVEPIKSYIDSCIESVGKDALNFIGRHGGYFELPTYSTHDYFTKTAYYFYINTNIMPSKHKIEQELSKYMNEELFFCIRNFADFKEMGFEIEQGKINTTTIIRLNNVLFKVNFPITIKKEESETKLVSFSNSINNIRLNTIYNVAKEIINEQMKDFSTICLSCIINFAIENDLYVDMNTLSTDTILFTITDFNSKIDNLPYKYIFANKYEQYSCTNLPPDASQDFLLECLRLQIEQFNYTLKIIEIPDLNAIVNVSFNYDVNAIGFNVTYSDFTNLFDINKTTGLINFTPTENQIGSYNIWIRAIDSLGNEDFETFQLNITNSS